MDKYCYSCAAPLANPAFKGPAENYCVYCSDEQGKLKSRQDIQQGISQWMSTWQPDVDEVTAKRRADRSMQAMPAWAD